MAATAIVKILKTHYKTPACLARYRPGNQRGTQISKVESAGGRGRVATCLHNSPPKMVGMAGCFRKSVTENYPAVL